jgi:hypothetical protein
MTSSVAKLLGKVPAQPPAQKVGLPPELEDKDYRDFCKTVLRSMGRPETVQEYLAQKNSVNFRGLYDGTIRTVKRKAYCPRLLFDRRDAGCKECMGKCEETIEVYV